MKGKDALSKSDPEIAAEWNYSKNNGLTPDMVTRGSNKKVWWCCKQGHEWQAKISNRTYLHHNCPYCSGKRNPNNIKKD